MTQSLLKILFASFFLACVFGSTRSYCQSTTPLMTIKNDSVAIEIESMSIDIKVIGNIATTNVHITFYNPFERDLEGEFNFPLAEGQTVFRFGMDVNGKMREGVVVDKEKGRRTFERIVRQNIDPGLLEMTKGNNYKARVFPIPARGRKSIVIGYEEAFSATGDAVYTLAMNYGLIREFFLKVEVFNQSIEPKIISNDLVNFRFEKWNSLFKAAHQAKNFRGSKPISFSIPQDADERIFVQQAGDNNFFYVTGNPVITRKAKALPKSILVLWDVSGSAKRRNLDKELTLLDQYFKNFQSVKVHLITFGNTVIDNKNFTITNGEWSTLRQQLTKSVFDGGTNLGSIDFKNLKADEALLFTDGIFTLGEPRPRPPSFPVYAINSNPVADHDWLQYVTQATGGVYVNLLSKTAEEAQILLANNQFLFISAEYADGITEVYPNKPQPVSGTFSLAGKFKGNQASIILNFGIGKEITFRKTLLIQATHTTTDVNIARIWANKKIQQLNLDPIIDKNEITETATRYSIVTPNTSLIVLDRIEDYVRYEISPPAELKQAYDSLILKQKQEVKLSTEGVLEKVIDDYKEQATWWIENEKDKVKFAESPTQTEAQRPAQPLQQPSQVQPQSQGTQIIIVNPSGYTRTINGKITSADDGSELPGANILLKGTAIGTTTNVEGNYAINVPDEGFVLVYSFIGYATKEVQVNARQSSPVNVQLESDVSHLSEIVVSSPNVQLESRSYAFSISKNDDAESIQEQVGGGNISEGHNQWGMTQGSGSMDLGKKPLYIIDGKPATDEEAALLKQEDISSLNVIKSESATALYGNRASDGVIVVVTKSALEDGLVLPDSITKHFEKGMTIKEWIPDAPYLDSLRAAPKHLRYQVYQKLKDEYENTPAFYLISGNYFVAEGETATGLRILSNIAEMELENHELLKVLAYRFTQLGETALAIGFLEKTIALRGNEPQSYRDLALAYEQHGNYQKALDNFMRIILMDAVQNDWDDRFPFIKNTVIDDMNNLVRKHGKSLDLSNVPKKLLQIFPADIRIVLDWNALETDIDLWIVEPNGEECSYKNFLTQIGGRLSADFTDGYGPEVYMVKNAMPGTYKVKVNYFDNRTQKISGPVTLRVTLYKYFGTPREQKQQLTVQLDDIEKEFKIVAEVKFEKK